MAIIQPLARLALWTPRLLADHAQGYADLAATELEAWLVHARRQAVGYVLATCATLLGLVLSGVALMLAAVAPDPLPQTAWALWLVPAVPLMVGAGCAVWLWNRGQAPTPLAALRLQWELDLAMLRAEESQP